MSESGDVTEAFMRDMDENGWEFHCNEDGDIAHWTHPLRVRASGKQFEDDHKGCLDFWQKSGMTPSPF